MLFRWIQSPFKEQLYELLLTADGEPVHRLLLEMDTLNKGTYNFVFGRRVTRCILLGLLLIYHNALCVAHILNNLVYLSLEVIASADGLGR